MMDKGFIHAVETFGTVDGPGIRYVLFLQGCPLRCKYCHNRNAWKPSEGQEMTVAEVLADVQKYFRFYQSSGGGLTASGGEPTLQKDFVTAVFQEIKAIGLNTTLDTSGFIDPGQAVQLMKYTDLVLLDIKALDPREHQSWTGVNNQIILDFANYLEQIHRPVWIRHVLIPGFNDDDSHLQTLAAYLKTLSNIEKVELLGYHKMGVHKWQICGEEDPLAHVQAADPQKVEAAKEFLRRQGVANVH